MIWCWRVFRKADYFIPSGLYVSDLIEYASIFLNIGPDDVLISAGGDAMYPVEFSCESMI